MGLIRFFDEIGRRRRADTSNAKELAEQELNRREKMAAPGTKVYFDEALIDKLEGDHQVLLRLFTQISEAYEMRRYKAAVELLKEFKGKICGHFLLENIKLYVYLRNVLRHDPQNLKTMQGFQREINEIGRVLDQFLDHYTDTKWTEATAHQFGQELESIGQALVTRIRKEEEVLYPLYMPPDAYVG